MCQPAQKAPKKVFCKIWNKSSLFLIFSTFVTLWENWGSPYRFYSIIWKLYHPTYVITRGLLKTYAPIWLIVKFRNTHPLSRVLFYFLLPGLTFANSRIFYLSYRLLLSLLFASCISLSTCEDVVIEPQRYQQSIAYTIFIPGLSIGGESG